MFDRKSTVRMCQPKATLLPLAAIAVLSFLSGRPAQAQGRAPSQPSFSSVVGREDVQLSLVLVVLDSTNSALDRQSVVKLYDIARKNATWHTTSNDSQASFYNLGPGEYDLDISAVGYKPQHRRVQIAFAQQNLHVEVKLDRDPNAVDLNASDDVIPPKSRKDAKRAVYALKSGNLAEAQKQLDKVYKLAPDSAQLNFLYGYLFLGRKDLEKSESYLTRAAVLDPRREQTLSLLGRVQLQRQQYQDAQKSLEQAIAINPQDPGAHYLLAYAYFNQKQYEKARQEAELALDGNKGSSEAQVILGQSLISLGQNDEGIKVLQTFLQQNPNDPDKPQLESLIAKVEAHEQGTDFSTRTLVPVERSLDESLPPLPLSAWGPPGIDEAKPLIASGAACPYAQVMEMSGKRVQQLVEDVSQFAATEDLLHERLDRFGNPTTKENRKFDYLATISENPPGYFSVDENRMVTSPLFDIPDGIVTRGFMSLALIFHPDVRDGFQITCEGLSQWQGESTWLMYFRQRDDKTSGFNGKFFVGNQPYTLKLKGRAWVSASNFEIVRMESELMAPAEKLTAQHQIVVYGPVHFKKQNVDLWLPKSVDIYLEINRRHYYRRHSFDRYVLFSVDAQEKMPLLKAGPNNTLVPDKDACSDKSSSSCQKSDSGSK